MQTLRQRAPSCIVSQVRIQNQGLWEVPEYPGVQSHFGEWDLRGRHGRPGHRLKLLGKPVAKLENTAGQERTAGQIVWALDSTTCYQPGKVELRMHMEPGSRR